MQPSLVLASSSITRKIQLERLNIPFETWSPNIDESPLTDEPIISMVERLAMEKAQAGATEFSNHILIAGDQVQEIDGSMQGKPHTHERALAQLQRANGRSTAFHSGLCVLNTTTGQSTSAVVTTHVTFKQLTDRQIERYLALEKPYHCAGSLKAEGIGLALVERIECQDPSDLLGLPLITLIHMLETVGFYILPR